MRNKILFFICMGLSLTAFSEAQGAWSFFKIPQVIFGSSAGYYRASLDDFTKIYQSRWDAYYSAQMSVRIYRMNYLTLQYARFQRTDQLDQAAEMVEVEWKERFINLGLRWYMDSQKRWRYYAGFGFTFINVEEKAGYSLLNPNNPKDVSTDGSGFFLEIGGDYIIFPHVALNLELEVSSAGEGGTPGFVGSSLGGYAFLAGVNFDW